MWSSYYLITVHTGLKQVLLYNIVLLNSKAQLPVSWAVLSLHPCLLDVCVVTCVISAISYIYISDRLYYLGCVMHMMTLL